MAQNKPDSILTISRSFQHQLNSWRRDFHKYPELSFQEHRTAQVVADELRGMGLRVETGVGKTGVIGHLGEGPPIVGLRADMDALPIQETNLVPYASCNPGVMHACGHDAHTAILLGAARLLSQMDDRPSGEMRFIFQPSEEDWDEDIKSGAVRMIEDGVLENVDAVIALHVDNELETGKIGIREGYESAAVDTFHAAITGKGCHGAYPHQGVDPIFILAQVINAINGIRARRIDPIHPVVVSIGSIHAGNATNVIPGRVDISGTIRSFDEDIRRQVWDELDQALGISRSLGGDYELSIQKGFPSFHNAPEIIELLSEVVQDCVGADSLMQADPGMGAEDFSYMAKLVPGAMFSLGVKLDDMDRPSHSSVFDLDENALPYGVAVLAETACRLLKIKPSKRTEKALS